MTRLTISTDSSEALEIIKKYIAAGFRIEKVKGPTTTEKGRMNYYIFLPDPLKIVNNTS